MRENNINIVGTQQSPKAPAWGFQSPDSSGLWRGRGGNPHFNLIFIPLSLTKGEGDTGGEGC